MFLLLCSNLVQTFNHLMFPLSLPSLGKFTLLKETKWCNSRHGTPLPRPRLCVLSDYVCNTSHGIGLPCVEESRKREMSTRVTRSTFTLIVLKSSYHHYFRISNAYHLSPLPLPRADNCSKVREFPKHPKGEDLSGRICARDSLSQKGEIYLVEKEGEGEVRDIASVIHSTRYV